MTEKSVIFYQNLSRSQCYTCMLCYGNCKGTNTTYLVRGLKWIHFFNFFIFCCGQRGCQMFCWTSEFSKKLLYWVSLKNCPLAFSVFSKQPRIEFFFPVENTDEVRSLGKFWRFLVDVKIVKIRHLISHISFINQNRKKDSCKKKHHNVAGYANFFYCKERDTADMAN